MNSSILSRIKDLERVSDNVAVLEFCKDGMYHFAAPARLVGKYVNAIELPGVPELYKIDVIIIDDIN